MEYEVQHAHHGVCVKITFSDELRLVIHADSESKSVVLRYIEKQAIERLLGPDSDGSATVGEHPPGRENDSAP